MTVEQRFERQLPAILEDLYLGPTPDYRDKVLATAVRSRQRPSWAFPGRWLSMTDMAARPAVVPRVPWRTIGVALLLTLLLLAALVYVGSRQPRVPQPFGVARNGQITWANDGDIFTGDPATGVARPVVDGPDLDRNPLFSRDGTHIAFFRQVPAQTGRFDLVVVSAAGTDPTALTPVPIGIPDTVEWAPDGASLLVNDAEGTLTSYALDGSAPRVILTGVHLEPGGFRPPNGAQILYERREEAGALYVMNADGSGSRRLFPSGAPPAGSLAGSARWSPDGRQIAFALQPSANADDAHLYVIDADGNGLHRLTDELGAWVENDPAWSPDGTRIAFNRWQRDDAGEWQIRSIGVVQIAGSAVSSAGVAPPSEGALIQWSPDGSAILALPGTVLEGFTWSPGAPGTVARPTLIDAAELTPRQLDWSVGSAASWQRLAP